MKQLFSWCHQRGIFSSSWGGLRGGKCFLEYFIKPAECIGASLKQLVTYTGICRALRCSQWKSGLLPETGGLCAIAPREQPRATPLCWPQSVWAIHCCWSWGTREALSYSQGLLGVLCWVILKAKQQSCNGVELEERKIFVALLLEMLLHYRAASRCAASAVIWDLSKRQGVVNLLLVISHIFHFLPGCAE